MSVPKIVKEVFLVLMCSFVMLILYNLFFSVEDTGRIFTPIDTDDVKSHYESTIQNTEGLYQGNDGVPDGVLWYASYQIQKPISLYYFNYCYLPNVHASDKIDKALGFDVKYSGTKMSETPSILKPVGKDNVDTVEVPPTSDIYSTGWK